MNKTTRTSMIFLGALAASACSHENGNPAPIESVDGTGEPQMPDVGTICGPDVVKYSCNGLVFGVYEDIQAPSNPQYSYDPESIGEQVICLGFDGPPADDDVEEFTVCVPQGCENPNDTDFANPTTAEDIKCADAIMAACTEACDKAVWGASRFATAPSGWEFYQDYCFFNAPPVTQGQLHEPDGPLPVGTVPGTVTACGGMTNNHPQAKYVGNCPAGECPEEDPGVCPDFGDDVTDFTQVIETSPHYTVRMDIGFYDDIMADYYLLFNCDDARYEINSTNSGGEMKDLHRGEWLYELGFRTGDEDLVVFEYDPTDHSQVGDSIDLDSFADIADAFVEIDGMTGDKYIGVTFTRGQSVTHYIEIKDCSGTC